MLSTNHGKAALANCCYYNSTIVHNNNNHTMSKLNNMIVMVAMIALIILYYNGTPLKGHPSTADTPLFCITDTYFGPVRACAIVNNLT